MVSPLPTWIFSSCNICLTFTELKDIVIVVVIYNSNLSYFYIEDVVSFLFGLSTSCCSSSPLSGTHPLLVGPLESNPVFETRVSLGMF